MPTLTRDNLTIEAFEERMRLRRRMFARSGVSVAALHASRELENTARQSVETCVSCHADESCGRWLDTVPEGGNTPVFCPNRRLIEGLKTQQHSHPKAR